MYPNARTSDLTIEALPSETVVYDTTNHRVHCLNEMAGLIWRHCDGKTSVDQIAGRVSEDLKLPVDSEVVKLGLQELSKRHLLVPDPEGPEQPTISRRDLGRRLALAGGTLVTLMPAITSIVAPTPAMAKSGDSADGKDKKTRRTKGTGRARRAKAKTQ